MDNKLLGKKIGEYHGDLKLGKKFIEAEYKRTHNKKREQKLMN